MVTVHTGGKPPRSCQGESKTGPRASRARTAEGEAVEPVEAVEKLGGNKWKQMETNGNKWKQGYPNISKLQMERLQSSPTRPISLCTMLKYAQQITLCVKNMQGNVWTVSRSLSLPRWKAWEKRQF